MNNSEKRPPTVLILEDVDWIRAGMKKEVERQGYDVLEAKDDAEALAASERQPIVLILTEEKVPTFSALMDRRRETSGLSAPVVIINPDSEAGARYGDAYHLSDYADIRNFLIGRS
jgi:DNA-binding response OmpR family regulator